MQLLKFIRSLTKVKIKNNPDIKIAGSKHFTPNPGEMSSRDLQIKKIKISKK